MRLYKLFDKDFKLLYIGRTTQTPEKRIIEHFKKKLRYSETKWRHTWLKKVRYFNYSVKLDNETDLYIYEIYAIARCDPEYNRKVFKDKPSFSLPELRWKKPKPIEEINIPIEKYRMLAKEIEEQFKQHQEAAKSVNL